MKIYEYRLLRINRQLDSEENGDLNLVRELNVLGKLGWRPIFQRGSSKEGTTRFIMEKEHG